MKGAGAKKPGTPSRPPRGGIEMLEGRIAPASLVNPSTVVFVDEDGDRVTVQFSKPLFTQTGAELSNVLNAVFKFDTGNVFTTGANDPGTPQQLQVIDLTKIPAVGTITNPQNLADGVSITITATQADTLKPGETEGQTVPGTDGELDGDGFANVGAINAISSAKSFGLGKVTIDGDLGQIDAGSSASAVGVVALKVQSLGAVADTQPGTTGFPNIESRIVGSLGSLTVIDDFKNAHINVVNGSGTAPKAIGKIGNIVIGGSLMGTAAVADASENTGLIQSATTIGKVTIGSGETGDGIIGGGGKNSGAIIAGSKITSIKINGDLQGGGGENSGMIKTGGDIGSITTGTGTAGHGILGGAGKNSGTIQSGAKVANITVNGDLLGGTGEGSGSVIGSGNINKILIGGKVDVVTETDTVKAGAQSARIFTKGDLGSVTITGNLEGGSTANTGTIDAGGKINSITIKGDLLGGAASAGGIHSVGKLGRVDIGGKLQGGTGEFSGFIHGDSSIDLVKIGGDLRGNTETAIKSSGIINAVGSIGEVSILGSLVGGKGDGSGSIHAGQSGTGSLDKVTIANQVIGGDGFGSAAINSGGKIGSVVVLNQAQAESAIAGGAGHFSGSIFSANSIGSVKITGDVTGGDGNDSGSIQAHGLIASLTLKGDLSGSTGDRSGSILAKDHQSLDVTGDLGKLNITGVLKAGQGDDSGAITADGNLVSLLLGGLDVGTFESGSAGVNSGLIATGLGLNPGNAGKISISGGLNGRGDNHTLLEIRGSLGSLSVGGDIAGGDVHVLDRLGKVTVGGDLQDVVVTAGSLPPASAKLATVISSITVKGDVSNSQILAGYDETGLGTNPDAQIGSVKVSGNWTASDLVAGVNAVNGYFGDNDDQVIDGGLSTITSRIANVIIGGTVSGTADLTTDNFGFVAEVIGKVKVGGKVITPNAPTSGLPSDVTVRALATV